MHWSMLLVALQIALLLVIPPFPAASSDADVTKTTDARAGDAKGGDAGVRGAPKTSPAKSDADAKAAKVVTPAKAGEAVNVNTADVKELMTLDGIGRRVAERIVEYRKVHGPFKKAEEVRKVEGIGAGLFERNRDRIVVR